MQLTLPIDASKPICQEDLDEQTPMFSYWYEFGRTKEKLVDVANQGGDVLIRVPIDKAQRIIQARDVFVAAMVKELCESGSTVEELKSAHPEHVDMINDALRWYRLRPWRSEVEGDEIGFISELLKKAK